MASEWALMRALAAVDVLGPKPGGSWSKTVEKIAAALDEARDEGAQRERWECHEAVSHATCGDDAQYSIAARGPMRGPEEEK